MKTTFYEKLKGINDYAPCRRYVDGTIVNPAAYKEWLEKRRKQVYLRQIEALGFSNDELVEK